MDHKTELLIFDLACCENTDKISLGPRWYMEIILRCHIGYIATSCMQ